MLGVGVSLRNLRSSVSASALSAYKVLTFNPELVFDFENEKYFTNSLKSTFSDAVTHTRASNATMVDSDGVLKWAPHNLALNSATPATQSVTVVSGADYTVECTGVSIALSGAGTGTVTEGNPVTITASTTTLTLTVAGSTGTMWVYRSDLGGMVDNPDRGDSYVPTTSSAVYLPRRGHHVWDGSAWVNEGLLIESESRTNLLTYSEDLSNAAWTKSTGITFGTPVTRKGISLDLIENDGAANFREVSQSIGSVPDGEYATFSVFVEAGTSTETAIRLDDSTANNRVSVPITWTSGVPSFQGDSTVGLTFVDAKVEDYADGLYRIWLAVKNDTGGALTLAADYYVQWDDTAAAVNTYAGGFQAEIGPTPSSYIPTSGSTVTRAAETLTIPAAKLPYSTTAMSIQMNGRVTYADENAFATWVPFRYVNSGESEKIAVEVSTNSTDTGRVFFVTRQNNVQASSSLASSSYLPGVFVPFNVSGRWLSNAVQGAVDGVSATANTSVSAIPNLSTENLILGYDYMGTIKKFRMWDEDITDTGLEEASS